MAVSLAVQARRHMKHAKGAGVRFTTTLLQSSKQHQSIRSTHRKFDCFAAHLPVESSAGAVVQV